MSPSVVLQIELSLKTYMAFSDWSFFGWNGHEWVKQVVLLPPGVKTWNLTLQFYIIKGVQLSQQMP